MRKGDEIIYRENHEKAFFIGNGTGETIYWLCSVTILHQTFEVQQGKIIQRWHLESFEGNVRLKKIE